MFLLTVSNLILLLIMIKILFIIKIIIILIITIRSNIYLAFLLFIYLIRIKRWFCSVRSNSHSRVSIRWFYFINFWFITFSIYLTNISSKIIVILWLYTLIFLLNIIVLQIIIILIFSCQTSSFSFTYIILIATHIITLIAIFNFIILYIVSIRFFIIILMV